MVPLAAAWPIHVGAVHVHLAAVLVDDAADLPDGCLEHAVGGGVGHHQRGECLLVLLGLRGQVGDVDVAMLVAPHRHHLHPSHHGARRVGAVRRHGDEAGDAMGVAAGAVPGADHHEARILALRARVGLERHAREAGDLGQLILERREQHLVALGLVGSANGPVSVAASPTAGSAESRPKTVMRSARSPKPTVSSSAMVRRVGVSTRRLMRRARAASTRRGRAHRSTSTQTFSICLRRP